MTLYRSDIPPPRNNTGAIRGLKPGESIWLPLKMRHATNLIWRVRQARPGAMFKTHREIQDGVVGRRVWCIADPFAD